MTLNFTLIYEAMQFRSLCSILFFRKHKVFSEIKHKVFMHPEKHKKRTIALIPSYAADTFLS